MDSHPNRKTNLRDRWIRPIVCQCEAGVSRSAGMAADLAKILHEEDQFFFDHYWPNRLGYRLLVAQGDLLHKKMRA